MIQNPLFGVGDLLVCQKALGFFNHVGVGVGPNKVLHNAPGKGEHISTVKEFSNGQPVEVRHTGADSIAVLGRTRKTLANPQKYNVVFRNCQHTASEIISGVARSPFEVACIVIGVIVVAVVFLSPKRS